MNKLYKNLLLLCVMVMCSSGAWATDVTANVTLSNGSYNTDHITWTLTDGKNTAVTIEQYKGTSSTNVNSSYINAPRIYKGHYLVFTAGENYKIKSISIAYEATYSGNSMTAGTAISTNSVTDNTTDVNRTWATKSGGTHVVSSASNDGLSTIYIQNVASADNVQLRPSGISVTYIKPDSEKKDAELSYTTTEYEVFTDGSFNSPKLNNPHNLAVSYASGNDNVATVNAETGAVTLVGAGKATITASSAETEEYEEGSASYTLNVYGVYNTMAGIQSGCAAYGSTEKPAKITLSNVYVTAVNGSNAYISDGTHGATIYKSGHGFAAGDKLACNNLQVKLLNYNSYTPEITNLSAETAGLTVTSGNTITPTDMTVAGITTANFGTLVKLTDVTYISTTKTFKDGDNSIYCDDVFGANPTLENGETYEIIGVLLFRSSTELKICPRTAADVKKVTKVEATCTWKNSQNESITSVEVAKNGTVNATFDTNSDGAKTYSSSNPKVATIDGDGNITLVADAIGYTTIKCETASTDTYLRSSSSFTLVVTYSDLVETSTLTFTAACGGSGTADDGAAWSVSSDASESTYEKDSGIHYGTGSATAEYVQLKSTSITNTITKVVVKARDAQALATISVTVGGTAFICVGSSTATNTPTEYTFIGAAQGDIIVRVDRGSAMKKAIYVKSIAVSYIPTVDITIGDAGFATLYSDKALDFSAVENLAAYTATCTNSTVTLTKIDDAPANTGVVLKGNKGSYSIPVIASSKTAQGELLGSTSDATAYDAYTGYDLYILAKSGDEVQFTKVNSGSVAKGKAFLKISEGAAAKFRVVFNGETTGIEAIEATANVNDGIIYNLAGQRVVNPTKGIFIKNGKKFIVR